MTPPLLLPGAAPGGFATTPIPAGGVALVLPRRLIVTLQSCHTAVPMLCRGRDAPEFTSFVCYLIQQRAAGRAAKHRPFIATLPPAAEMTSALFMSAEEVGDLPPEYAKACTKARLQAQASGKYIDELCGALLPAEAELFRDLSAREWAASMVQSRAFRIRGRMSLLPVIDVFNNAEDGCRLEYTSEGGILLRAFRR